MPQRSKGARLWLDPKERVWVIRDGTGKHRTGCRPHERQQAEEELARYLAAKYTPVSERRPAAVKVADVLTYYLDEVAPGKVSADRSAYAVDTLLDWWGKKTLADVKRSTCEAYVEHRTAQSNRRAKTAKARAKLISTATAVRELGVLQAAINAYHAEHQLDAVPVVTMPPRQPGRQDWLTRDQAARFLRAARTLSDKHARRALIRFTLMGLYTGTRSGALCLLSWLPSVTGGWIDLDAGVLHRKGEQEIETKKRRPRARIPIRLLAHLRRWRRSDGDTIGRVIHYGGLPMLKMRRAWNVARGRAGLGPEIVPHILRHTAATWLMQEGEDIYVASGFLGMSAKVLEDVYGHHHPDFQTGIADRMGRRARARGPK